MQEETAWQSFHAVQLGVASQYHIIIYKIIISYNIYKWSVLHPKTKTTSTLWCKHRKQRSGWKNHAFIYLHMIETSNQIHLRHGVKPSLAVVRKNVAPQNIFGSWSPVSKLPNPNKVYSIHMQLVSDLVDQNCQANSIYLVGVSTPLKNEFVNWDDFSRCLENKHVPNHQPTNRYSHSQ